MVTEIESETLEREVRSLGERWARTLWAEQESPQISRMRWPGTLQDARRLISTTFGHNLSAEREEALALIAERSARTVWNRSSR
jgi:hypothetical protein